MTIIRSIPGIVALICVFILPVQVSAQKHSNSAEVELEVISDQRGSLRKFAVPTERTKIERSYVIARNDERYRIRVSNRSNRSVGVVIAVDGRNIISGSKSHLKSHERMYILGPYQAEEFEGWRTGRNRTNRFYFTNMNDSYAADWGDQTAMGVIALAVFNERQQQFNKHNSGKIGKHQKFDKSQGKKRGPGTGFGEQQWSPSREVHFVAEKRAIAKKFIKYEYRSTLCREGIVQCRPGRRQNRFWPQNSRNNGYVPFPSWHFHLKF